MRPPVVSQPAEGQILAAHAPADLLSPELAAKRNRLLETIRGYESCAVAFSGGVDSAVVAQAAQLALGDQAIAVTGISASLAQGELAAARELARKVASPAARVALTVEAIPPAA